RTQRAPPLRLLGAGAQHVVEQVPGSEIWEILLVQRDQAATGPLATLVLPLPPGSRAPKRFRLWLEGVQRKVDHCRESNPERSDGPHYNPLHPEILKS